MQEASANHNRNEAIRAYIVENFLFGKDDDSLSEDTSFIEKGIVDSTGVLELIAFLEERFQISIEDEDVVPDNLDSIRKIAAFLARKG